MTPDRWTRTKQLLQQALELKPEQRSAFLSEASGGDTELQLEVESLLSFEGDEPKSEAVHLGPYTVLREIGRG